MKKQILLASGIISMIVVSCGSPKVEEGLGSIDSAKTIVDTAKTIFKGDTAKMDTLIKNN